MSDLPTPGDLLGQETAVRTFDAAIATGRIACAYLLHGPAGIGRSLGASIFAHALLCERRTGLLPCRTCRACRANANGTNADFLTISADSGPRFDDDAEAARSGLEQFSRAARAAAKPAPRRTIQVRTLRRLLELLSLASSGGGWKVALIDAFDEVEEEGTALLLKTLEEAPAKTTFLLLARGSDGVPDTILSRCQRVRFRPLAPDVVRRIAASRSPEFRGAAPQTADLLVRLAQGSPGRAIGAAAMGVVGAPADAARVLGESSAVPEALLVWVREAGKELESQRERVRQALALALLVSRETWPGHGQHAAAPIRGALESLEANVAPEWVLRALWVRAARARPLSV